MQTQGQQFLAELESEARATRASVERVPEEAFGWRPHDKSMPMGYLAALVAEIPLWVAVMASEHEMDYVTFPHAKPTSGPAYAQAFDDNMARAREALGAVQDGAMEETFTLKANGTEVLKLPRWEFIRQSINHLVHHRGQLTVYLRLNDIAVPALYGPSADDNGGFAVS